MRIGQRSTIKNPEDDGITFKEALKLIEDLEFYDELYEILNIDTKLNERINIKGSKSVVELAIKQHNYFKKIDLESTLENISILGIYNKNEAKLEFSGIQNDEILKITKKDIIEVDTVYNSKKDFFNIFNADDYINFCLRNKLDNFIETNIDLLDNEDTLNDYQKKYRILKDKDDNFHLRAITSTNRYYNYNINFSIFITLLALNEIQKKKTETYEIELFSCSESEVTLNFRRKEIKNLLKNVNVNFVLELENDEIKREAVKFKGNIKVISNDTEFYISPTEKPYIIYFNHSTPLPTVKSIVNNMSKNIESFISKTYKNVENISKIKDHKEVQNYLYNIADKSRQPEFVAEHKKEVLRLLEEESRTIYDLFEKLGKVNHLMGESFIKSKDYWRGKLYNVLVKGK